MRSAIAVTRAGLLEAGTMLWAQGGELRVTLALRTSYALAPGPLRPVAPAPLDADDRHYRGDPARAVRSASDFALRLPRAEIVHAGAVVAPAGTAVVRIAVLRQNGPVFEKRLLASAKNDSPGLGPLGRGSPERRALLRGGAEPRADATGVVRLPPDFDFSYYQCAPADQQMPGLVGGDQILIGNLHPELPEIVVALPTRAPAARAALGAEQAPIALACKRVVIDTDQRTYTLLWYGELELPGEAAVPHLKIDARVMDVPAQAPHPAPAFDPRQLFARGGGGPARPSFDTSKLAAPAPGRGARVAPTGTAMLEGTIVPDDAAPAAPALPFANAAQPKRDGQRASTAEDTPWGKFARRAAPAAGGDFSGTLALDEPEAPKLPPPPAPPPPSPEPQSPPVQAAARTPGAGSGSPWAPPPAPAPAPAAPAPPPRPKGPAAAMVSLKKDGNERFRKR